MKRMAIARDTLDILETGFYLSTEGKQVDLASEIQACTSETRCYDPDNLSQLETDILFNKPRFDRTNFVVKNETTLMGAARMARLNQYNKIGVLNFASARNPGGGFLNGAQAQEESLARSSALYPSLLKCPEYYDFHRSNPSLLYSDRIIYSPFCPVFKTDSGDTLKRPYFVDFITSPAPNAGAIAKNQPELISQIPEALYSRGSKLLSLAALYECDALVLGAWGCGVFRNQPAMVAKMFADFLSPNGKFWGRFHSVLFSVLDTGKNAEIFTEFDRRFATD